MGSPTTALWLKGKFTMSKVLMTVRGEKRNVELLKDLGDGKYNARTRNKTNGNSIRGIASKNVKGVWRFQASNPSYLD